MSDDWIEELKVDFSLFLEAGFVAVKQLDETGARNLFHAAQLLRPDSVAPLIGLGYIELNKLELKAAKQIFQEVLDKEPENALAQTFLGIAEVLNKEERTAGEQLIREAMAKSGDPTVVNLGKIALEWNEKDLKKKDSKAPFFSGFEPKSEKGKK